MSAYRLRAVVWETTLACNLACTHCGSAAGRARRRELDTAEALDLVDQLADLGVEELTLSGGEFLVRDDWPAILERVRRRGIAALVISNGLAVDAAAAREMARQGVRSVSISVDGPEAVHDALRPIPGRGGGSLAAILRAFRVLAEHGPSPAAITQVNAANLPHLPALRELLVAHGVRDWQVQLTHPMGRAATLTPLPPERVPELLAFIRETQRQGRIRCLPADDVGWFGPEEHLLRSGGPPARHFWTGCQAGLSLLGILSDGGVKGCLSMQTLPVEASLRERSLRDIWEDPELFAYNRRFDPADLRGGCAGCPFGAICRAGCHSLAATTVGHLLDNPYCVRRHLPAAGAAEAG